MGSVSLLAFRAKTAFVAEVVVTFRTHLPTFLTNVSTSVSTGIAVRTKGIILFMAYFTHTTFFTEWGTKGTMCITTTTFLVL